MTGNIRARDAIFDYCGNFEFFRQHKEGYEAREAKTLSENIFGEQVRLIGLLQEDAYLDEEYQNWRSQLVSICHGQIAELNRELISVRLRLQYVEKYRGIQAFEHLSEGDKGELIQYIAPIVQLHENDEFAKRFDNFMYGLMLAAMEQMPSYQRAQKQLRDIAAALEGTANIPQVNARIDIIKSINTDDFWASGNVLLLERVRTELRGLIQFLYEDSVRALIFTRLADPITAQSEGQLLDAAYDFEDYRAKVNRYINEHGHTLAIHKLTHNIPLSPGDYQELERVLTVELGSEKDYRREFENTPFGLLVRRIANLDHDAARQAFSSFINDQSLNQRQIAFVHKIINHIERNGYMESVAELQRPPFDKPVSFMKLFDPTVR